MVNGGPGNGGAAGGPGDSAGTPGNSAGSGWGDHPASPLYRGITGGPDWARAVEIDSLLRTEGARLNRDMRQTMYLHGSCKPLTEVDFRPRINVKELQLGFGFDVECEGVCGV